MIRKLLIAVLGLSVSACAQPGPRNSGVYLLLDTSGTYAGQLRKAQEIINYTLSRLDSLDSFAVARIDTGSFSDKDIVAKVTFDDRPSAMNAQKRQFAHTVAKFLAHVKPSEYTDITGGLLQAVEFLNEKKTAHKTILIFSDMKQDLKSGYVRNIPVPLKGFDVVALNVTKLHSDNVDPREYLDRLKVWRKRVESQGGHWRVINDLDHLESLLKT